MVSNCNFDFKSTDCSDLLWGLSEALNSHGHIFVSTPTQENFFVSVKWKIKEVEMWVFLFT